MSETQATYAAPPIVDGLMTSGELVEIERRWGRFPVVGRLLAHIRVLHYRYQTLVAWAQAIDGEVYRSKFGSD